MRKPSLDTRQPAALGRIARQNPANRGMMSFTPKVSTARLAKVEIAAAHDGFPYLKDLIQVLFALYGQGRMSRRLRAAIKRWTAEWDAADADPKGARSKVNARVRRDVYDVALARWQRESKIGTANSMIEFLLERYATGGIQIALRCGKSDE